MILPSKHTRLSESILGLAGFLLSYLSVTACSIDDLWNKLSNTEDGRSYFRNHSFDNVVKAVDLLYMMGIVDLDEQGKIVKL